jgi:diguanylate cyclase (GGDEF)-like protein
LTAILTYFLTPIKGLLVAILEILIFAYVSFNLFLKDYRIDFFSPLFMIALVYLGTSGYKYVTLLIESVTLKTLAITDGLTGLFLPRYFQVRLQNEFERTVRYGPVLSLVMMDIDHFKQINDTYGHQQGNVVLKAMAEILRNGSRKVDILARYGGEEFCALLPHTTQAGALEYSERLRKAIEAYAFPSPKGPLKITLSFGVVGIPREGISSPEEFVACADAALYRAKAEGRNRVYPFDPALDKK